MEIFKFCGSEGTAPSLVPTTMPLKTAWEHSQKVIVDFSDSTIGKGKSRGKGG